MSADWYELARLARRLTGARGRFANPPFLGYLDRPQRGSGGGLKLSGWLFNRGVPIVELGVTSQGGAEAVLRRGLARPDLAERFAGEPRAASAGFDGEMPIGFDTGRTTELQLWARLADGRRLVCFRTRVAIARRRNLVEKWAADARRPLDWSREQLARRRLLSRFEAILRAASAVDAPELTASSSEIFGALWETYRSNGGAGALERTLARAGAELPRRAATAKTANGAREQRRSILVVSGMFPSTEHAGGLRLFDITQALARRHDVDLYSVYREDLDEASLERLLPSLRAVRLVGGGRELVADDARAWLGRNGSAHYDVIHFEYPSSTHLIPVLRPYAKKTLFTLMECVTRRLLIDLSLRLREGSPHLGSTAQDFLESFNVEREALHACDQGIAVTDEDAEFAVRAFGVPRPVVVPTCLSETAFLDGVPATERPPSRLRTAAFVGYFEHYPNLDAMRWYLQQVHFEVLRRVPDYQLLIIGRGDTGALRAFQREPSVKFVGRVEALAPELQAAQIGLAPIVSGAGIRGKINQYSAVGRPTVSTTLGASGLPYRHEESILIADSPADFARAVERLLTDDPLYRRLQAGARRVAETSFRWPRQIARIESLHGA
jgi:glycosyltransferase involved in cell wall biosynthesis